MFENEARELMETLYVGRRTVAEEVAIVQAALESAAANERKRAVQIAIDADNEDCSECHGCGHAIAKRIGLDNPAAESAHASGGAGKLLHSPSDPLPQGCYCQPGRCMAPIIMGRQMKCRDPENAARQPLPAPPAEQRCKEAEPEKGDGWCIDCTHADVWHNDSGCRICAETSHHCLKFNEAMSPAACPDCGATVLIAGVSCAGCGRANSPEFRAVVPPIEKHHDLAKEIARNHNFDPKSADFARCVGAVMEAWRYSEPGCGKRVKEEEPTGSVQSSRHYHPLFRAGAEWMRKQAIIATITTTLACDAEEARVRKVMAATISALPVEAHEAGK